ncbi:MAG TPA: GNAT family N-acetyltransferase [Terracidiphilus sp.]|jgi:GNAT superfamily N-acetyltransferase|nr:GNAT family N-acetyltransferase [Terracidiphilus sp.]
MEILAREVSLQEIAGLRDQYRAEMNCQVVHDSLHVREGWTKEFLLEGNGETAGYGSIAVAGPWKGTRTVFEFYVLPEFGAHAFDCFDCFVEASQATAMEIQSNQEILLVMLHTYAHDIKSERIVFEEGLTTAHPANGAVLKENATSEWILEVDGVPAGSGGILYHYNRPYGDVYMEIAEPYRRRGYGSFLVQELKKICRERAGIPAARCSTENIASRKTLQRAGFVPYAHILLGTLPSK